MEVDNLPRVEPNNLTITRQPSSWIVQSGSHQIFGYTPVHQIDIKLTLKVSVSGLSHKILFSHLTPSRAVYKATYDYTHEQIQPKQ